MKLSGFFKRKKNDLTERVSSDSGVRFDINNNEDGNTKIRLSDVEQRIGGIRQLTQAGIDEMVARKHDLDFQLTLCQRLMVDGDILPFPFERAVILLRKAKRFEDEQEICRYVVNWCRKADKNWDGRSAKHWMSPRLQKILERSPRK